MNDNDIITIRNYRFNKDTEIEITNIYPGYNSNFYKGIVGDREATIDANAIEITDYSPIINWEQRRYEIAKDILAAFNPINSRSYINPDTSVPTVLCKFIIDWGYLKVLKHTKK